MKLCKFLFFILLGMLLKTILFSQSLEREPDAVFTAVFWDRFTTKNISYMPWGNENDLNATEVTIQVGFSTPSQPFAYYGKEPIKFFEKSFRDVGDEDTPLTEHSQKIGEFNFSYQEGRTQHFLLIFLKQPKHHEFKIFSISLAQQDLEYGSFICYSQHKEPLYLIFGDKKQILGPGKSVKFKQAENEKSQTLPFKGFVKKDSEYQEVISDFLAINSENRAILFLSPVRNRLRLKRFYLNRVPIESTIGFNSNPINIIESVKSEVNATEALTPMQI